ncbi:MAG TPA: Ig-like domain-containing protein, partial [Reyranella sp.]|nr:Ig-like domain-containing protein [Reyranella sp.]
MATTAIGNDATDLGSILQAAMAGSYVANGSGQTFTVSKSIVIYVNSTTQGPLGLDLGGGTIISNITDGSPVIKVVVGPNVDLRYLTFSNFTIQGNGREGSGIQIVAGANERWVYNFGVDNVTVNGVGGYGIDVQGSVFEGIISDSWMTNNGQGGAYFSHLADGQASALRWYGGGFEDNGGAGMTLDNGVRDMTVDGATFSGNQGGGISAGSGITAVSNSEFIDNDGYGVWFQNYGNFDNNTFTTSGSQMVGVTGWLNGNATVVNSSSVWTGSGADPTTLANLNGYGGVFTSGDTGKIVTGSSLSVGTAGGGNLAQVSVSGQGVAQPTLQAVSAATTAPLANSNGTGAVETALKAAVATGNAELTESSYSVSAPIVINLTNANQGPINLDFGGAKLQSAVNGGPIIEIIVGPGVHVSQLTLSNLLINGSGRETAGIKIVADGADRSIQNLSINGVNIEHTGGIGLDVIGNVSGTIFNSWMNGNAGGGARFANGPNGGVADDLYWIGGGFRKNEVAGLILDNGTYDMSVKSAYFCENVGVGIYATSGITLVKGSGFENNGGTGAVVKGPSTFVDDTFSTWGAQKVAVGGYLSNDQVNLTGVSSEYYGPGSDPTLVANLQGTGTLAIAGGGKVVAGSGISVTGGVASVPIGDPETTTGEPAPVPVPVVTEKLVSDTGTSASDGITKSAALTGTADPNATVKIAIDGTQVGTTTADATGKWSYTPTGLSDGRHTVVVSETNAGGQTGSATMTFTLDTKAPVVTQGLVGGGTSTTTGALTGTAEAGAVLRFTVDGTQIAGTATADATGKWTYTPGGLAAGSHTVVATQTDAAGNTGSASLTFTVSGSGTGGTTTPPPGVTGLAFTGATWANGQMTVTGTTSGPGQTVWIYDGSSWAGAVTSNASSQFTFTAAAAAGSTHSFGAIAMDASGTTVGKTTTPYVYTAGTSTPAPTVPTVTAALSADTGSSTTDKLTSSATLSGTADPNATIKFTVDGTAIAATATADATGKWTFTPTGLGDGQHTIVASETNAAGTGSATVAFTLDKTAPTVTSKLTNDTGASATDKITSNATISGTAAPNSAVKFTVDGAAITTTATADANGAWSFTPTGLSDGQHTIVASQTDAAGNIGSSTLAFTLDTAAGTLTERLANDTGSSATDKITSSATLAGTATPGAVIKFTVDGAPITATVTADASGNWTFTPTGLADGKHTVVASQTDQAGNATSSTLTFTLDTAAPVVTAS